MATNNVVHIDMLMLTKSDVHVDRELLKFSDERCKIVYFNFRLKSSGEIIST